jgi:hypothetical protein
VTPADAPACLATQTETIDNIAIAEDCHVAAVSAALATAKNDLIFFLPPGESWSDDFVARIHSVFQTRPEADVVFCDSAATSEKRRQNSPEIDVIDLGFSVVATYTGLDYVARPLSCFAVRRRIVERILPLVNDPDWVNEPEACLSIAASLASARTFHLPLPLVNVAHAAEKPDPTSFAHRLKTMRLIGKIANQLGLNPDFVIKFLELEYNSRHKDLATIINYCRLLQQTLPDTRSRRKLLLRMHGAMSERRGDKSSFGGYLRCWWAKQRLRWTGKLTV